MTEELTELIDRSYEALKQGGLLWHLVKFNHITMAFIHFTTVATAAYKLAAKIKENSKSISILEDLIYRLEEESNISFEKYHYLVGLLHDYDKLSPRNDKEKLADNILKVFNVPEQIWGIIKQDAKSVEAGTSQTSKHHDLVTSICHIADVLASKDSVLNLRETLTESSTERKLRLLKSFGLELAILYISSHRMLTILRSRDILDLFKKNGWEPLLIYKDGVIFLGTKTSTKVSLSEMSDLLALEIFNTLYGIENVEKNIEEAIPRSFSMFIGYVNEALVKELPEDRDTDRPHLVVLANNMTRVIRGETDIKTAIDEVLKKTQKDIQSFQKSLLPANRRPIKNIVSGTPTEELIKMIKRRIEEIKKSEEIGTSEAEVLAILSYLVVGWSKESEKIIKLYKAMFKEEPFSHDILTLTLATVTKIFQYKENNKIDELTRSFEEGFREFLGTSETSVWKYEVRYYVSTYISGDIVEPIKEDSQLKETTRCLLCRSPIFSEEPMQVDEYGKAIGGGRGVQQMWTNDDIPLTDKDKYAQSTAESSKYTRSICTLCKYEATIIGKALEGAKGVSIPFIAIYFRPAITPEILSFIATNRLSGVKLLSLAEIYGEEATTLSYKKPASTLLTLNVVPNYLGAFVIFSYKEGISDEDSGKLLKSPDLSGKRDEVYYGLLLIPELAKRAGGGQFKICLSVEDLLIPPEKLIEAPFAIEFVEELNSTINDLREYVKRRYKEDEPARKQLLELYSVSYHYIMRTLEGIAIKVALWYDHSKASKEKKTATWIIKGIEDMEGKPLPIALLTPPLTGFDKAEKEIRRADDWVWKRELYRKKFNQVYEIASELDSFLYRVHSLLRGCMHV